MSPLSVFGDVILDRYTFVDYHRFSPENPYVPVASAVEHVEYLGGAANVALNIRRLGGDVTLRMAEAPGSNTGTPERVSTEDMVQRCCDADLPTKLLPMIAPAVVKHRFLTREGRHLYRVDYERTPEFWPQADYGDLGKTPSHEDVAVVADYGKGVLYSPELRRHIARHTKIVVDSRNVPSWSSPDTIFKINRHQAIALFPETFAAATSFSGTSLQDDLDRLRHRLYRSDIKYRAFVLTLGADGMAVIPPFNAPVIHRLVAPWTRDAVDVCGAGDTVLAVLALRVARDGGAMTHKEWWQTTLDTANAVAAKAVATLGVAAPELADFPPEVQFTLCSEE